MIPSRLFLPLILLLFVTPAIAQVAQDVRLSPDDRKQSVLPTHRTASACTLGDRTMVVWGTTVGDAIGGERMALMMGVQKGRTWLVEPHMLVSPSDNSGTVVRVIAIDSIFLVLWHSDGEQGSWGLRGQAWYGDGTPASEPLYFGRTPLQGLWAHPVLPGVVVLWRSGVEPIAISWNEGIRTDKTNPIIAPDRSFEIGPDSSMVAINEGKIVRYASIFDTVPVMELDPPISDSSATANLPFVGTVSDSSYSIIVLVARFSEGYSRSGSSDSSTVLMTLHHYRNDRLLPGFDTVARQDEVLGTAVPGFGVYREYRTGGIRKYCGDGKGIFIEFTSASLRGGSPDGPTTTSDVGFLMSENGEIITKPQYGLPTEIVTCSPSGDLVEVTYEENEGMTFIRVMSGVEDFLAPAVFESRSPAHNDPILLEEGGQAYVLWRAASQPWALRKIQAFSEEGIDSVDVVEYMNLKDLSDNYGCGTRINKRYVTYYPGRFFLSETQLRHCTVAAQGGPVDAPFARTHVSGVRDGRFRPIAEYKAGPEIRQFASLTFYHYRALAFEPDDGSVLVAVSEDNSSIGGQEPKSWIEALSGSGNFQWRSTVKAAAPQIALPTGGTTWAYFSGNTLVTMNADSILNTFVLPSFDSVAILGHQSLPGAYVLRANRVWGDDYRLELQLINHGTGRVWEQVLPLTINAGFFAEGIMTHPVDSTRFIVWGGRNGIFAVRYSSDFQQQLMPPIRISETADSASNPSATFINDTLTVVWEDHRHGIPAIYGLQWKVEAVKGTNSVDQEGTPATLDLSWRKSSAPSEPTE